MSSEIEFRKFRPNNCREENVACRRFAPISDTLKLFEKLRKGVGGGAKNFFHLHTAQLNGDCRNRTKISALFAASELQRNDLTLMWAHN
jgi:hypothetical protein